MFSKWACHYAMLEHVVYYKQKKCPATYISLTMKYNTRTTNHHLCGSKERNGAQKRSKVSIGRTLMQAKQQLQLAKRHIRG